MSLKLAAFMSDPYYVDPYYVETHQIGRLGGIVSFMPRARYFARA